jgi:hypothetical protein
MFPPVTSVSTSLSLLMDARQTPPRPMGCSRTMDMPSLPKHSHGCSPDLPADGLRRHGGDEQEREVVALCSVGVKRPGRCPPPWRRWGRAGGHVTVQRWGQAPWTLSSPWTPWIRPSPSFGGDGRWLNLIWTMRNKRWWADGSWMRSSPSFDGDRGDARWRSLIWTLRTTRWREDGSDPLFFCLSVTCGSYYYVSLTCRSVLWRC